MENSEKKKITWQKMPGLANDITVGANNQVMIIGQEENSGGSEIFKWQEDKWEQIPGGATRLATDLKGEPWAINEYKEVFKHNGKGWDR